MTSTSRLELKTLLLIFVKNSCFTLIYPQKKLAIPIFFDVEAPQENPLLQETSPWLICTDYINPLLTELVYPLAIYSVPRYPPITFRFDIMNISLGSKDVHSIIWKKNPMISSLKCLLYKLSRQE